MSKTPHSHFDRGTPIRVKLRAGGIIIDHFEDHKSGIIVLRKRGRLRMDQIKSIGIVKGKP